MKRQEESCGAMVAPMTSALQRDAAIYFGLSCALSALHGAGARGLVAGCDLGAGQCRWSRARELVLRGSVQLLGVLVAQPRAEPALPEKFAKLELEVEELRRMRAEDAKANEKVAGIFSAHEQRWLSERKALRRQLQAVVSEARSRKLKQEEAMSELRRQLDEQLRAVGLKDEAIEQESKKREEVEVKLRSSDKAAEELRERVRKDAQEHAAELRKHKAAFVELASAQRQLEAELARAARQAEAARGELKEALDRRDEALATVEELSAETARLRRDAEHKDKILSALLRKSKVDMEDKEMLVREVKLCKARKKQAELETERWRKMWESRQRRSSRSTTRCTETDHPGCYGKLAPDTISTHDAKILFVDHVEGETKKNRQATAAKEETTIQCVDRYPSHVDDKPAVDEYQQHMQEWFQMETDKYATMIKHRHNAEIEAFTEQLRLKDEKLETFRWRTVSMDVELTRLRCRTQEVEGSLTNCRQHYTELESLLSDRENEIRSLKEQLMMSNTQKINSEICHNDVDGDDECEHRIPCSPVLMIQGTNSRECDALTCGARDPEDSKSSSHHEEMKQMEPVPYTYSNKAFEMGATTTSLLIDASAQAPEIVEEEWYNDVTVNSHRTEIDEEKGVYTDPGNAHALTRNSSQEISNASLAAGHGQKTSTWKMDIRALAVSYKIKRLKQQLLVLEKLSSDNDATATRPSIKEESGSSSRRQHRRNYQVLMSFLNKHIKRYESLEAKIDDLCARMEESKRIGGREQPRDRSEALGQFLEETFQLQRYMVAIGQKLLEMQSKIAASWTAGGGGGDDDGGGANGIDMPRFMEIVGTLLRDVQRGLEVRIARIIGDLEGTLTFHGILQTAF